MANAFNPETTFPDFNRSDFIPIIDMNTIKRLLGIETDDGFAWCRVDKSEQYDFAPNAQTETKKYIDSKNDYTYISSYNPSMEQEIIIDGNNECYSLMHEYKIKFPTGADAEVPCALIEPSTMQVGVADALVWEKAMLVPGNTNSVDKKMSFTMNFNGDMRRGTGAKNAETGRFEIAFDDEDKGGEVETLSAKSTKASAFKAESDK